MRGKNAALQKFIAKTFKAKIRQGYALENVYKYTNSNGKIWCRRVRFKNPGTGEKYIRPVRYAGGRFCLGEPQAPLEGKPLYRLHELTASDPAAIVYVVEGEACADALAKLGMLATTSGSATSADGANWMPLQGRTVVLWPDNDNVGAEYMQAIAAKLHKLGCALSVIDVTSLCLAEHGDCVDWLAVHKNAATDDVRALATIALPSMPLGVASAPEPLRRPTPPPEPYPIDQLGSVLAPACRALRRVIQAPDAVCGASLLAAASLASQGLADVHIDGRTIPLSLWMLTVAESGERKTAIDSEVLRAAREHEKALASKHVYSVAEHENKLAEWQTRCEVAKKDAREHNGKGLAAVLRKIGPAPPAPLKPVLLAADFTAEGLAKLLTINLPCIGVFTDEAALVFGGHGMTKETATRTAGTLSKLWDNGTLDRIRATEGATKLYGRRLALHLMAQPIIAERALSDDLLSGQGFLARCLLAWPEPTAGTRLYVAKSLRDDADLRTYHGRLAALFAKELPLAEGQQNELAPRRLVLTPKAKAKWMRIHNAIEAAMAPTGRYALVKPWASKAPEQILRVAGVFILVSNPDAQTINATTIRRAAELVKWHLNEAVRLAGTAELSPEVCDAEALLNWCHETGRHRVHSREVLQYGPNRIRELALFKQAMDALECAGWASPVDGGAHIDGARRRHVWDIVPKGDS